MKVIRYSCAFKLQAVGEVESGKYCAGEVRRRYGIRGSGTVMRWVRQLGSGRHGKIIRVEKPEEIDEAARLRAELKRVKEALADAHLELALEKAYLAEACQRMQLTVEGFKKKRPGRPPTGRSRPTER